MLCGLSFFLNFGGYHNGRPWAIVWQMAYGHVTLLSLAGDPAKPPNTWDANINWYVPKWSHMDGRCLVPEHREFISKHPNLTGTARAGFYCPIWLLALVFTPAYVPALIRRFRSHPAGCCQRCGYDLRATPAQCPECGTPAKVGA